MPSKKHVFKKKTQTKYSPALFSQHTHTICKATLDVSNIMAQQHHYSNLNIMITYEKANEVVLKQYFNFLQIQQNELNIIYQQQNNGLKILSAKYNLNYSKHQLLLHKMKSINYKKKNHQIIIGEYQNLKKLVKSKTQLKFSMKHIKKYLNSINNDLFLIGEKINCCQQNLNQKLQIINAYIKIANEVVKKINNAILISPMEFKSLNTPTLIKDIIVTQPQNLDIFGIVNNSNNIVEKICLQLQEFFNKAKKNHQENIHIKHYITRLSTDEFSFYTRKPITISQYQKIIAYIENKLKLMPENIHFILASFAVLDTNSNLRNIVNKNKILDTNSVIRNVVIHCQSGVQTKIHHSCKAFCSDLDPTFKQPLIYKTKRGALTDSPMMLEVRSTTPIKWGYGTLIHIKTNFNSEYLTNIQICVDIQMHHGKNNLLWAFKLYKEQNKLIPIFYSSILTSRSTPLITFDNYAANILHVDANFIGNWCQVTQAQPIITNQPIKVECDKRNFDHNKQITYMPPQLLATMPTTVQKYIIQHNKSVLNKPILIEKPSFTF